MPNQFKTIHMPKRLYEEIEKLVQKPDSEFKNMAEVCKKAGEMLIEYNDLR